MASNTQGIQQLLAAEKKAADKVGEARKRKFNSRIEWIFFRRISERNELLPYEKVYMLIM